MANDLNSAVNALKGILGDDAENKIQSVMQSLSSSSDDSSTGSTDNSVSAPASHNSPIDDNTLEYIMKMKNIVDEMSHGSDDRSNLLLSLRPYMREGRRKSIDNALRLMTLTKLSGVFSKL